MAPFLKQKTTTGFKRVVVSAAVIKTLELSAASAFFNHFYLIIDLSKTQYIARFRSFGPVFNKSKIDKLKRCNSIMRDPLFEADAIGEPGIVPIFPWVSFRILREH